MHTTPHDCLHKTVKVKLTGPGEDRLMRQYGVQHGLTPDEARDAVNVLFRRDDMNAPFRRDYVYVMQLCQFMGLVGEGETLIEPGSLQPVSPFEVVLLNAA